MVLCYEVSNRTSSACNKLFPEQRRCTLDIKENTVSNYSQNYTNIYLKQRNIISFNTLHLQLPKINFLHFNCSINTIKQIFQCFPFYKLGPTFTKIISNFLQGKSYYYFRAQLIYNYNTEIK